MIGAVMQPYFFPYIGYYQLAYASDAFVFLDDVNHIKRGYVNRNAIVVNGKKYNFTIPVINASQNRFINQHDYVGDFNSFLDLLDESYCSAINYSEVIKLVRDVVLDCDDNVSRKNARSLMRVFDYLGLERKFLFSSNIMLDDNMKGQDRIIGVCKKVGIEKYRNSVGGAVLYDKKEFAKNAIDLKFLKCRVDSYRQNTTEFLPNLSIIDVLMNCEKSQVIELMAQFELSDN